MNEMALDENVHHLCVYLPKYKTVFCWFLFLLKSISTNITILILKKKSYICRWRKLCKSIKHVPLKFVKINIWKLWHISCSNMCGELYISTDMLHFHYYSCHTQPVCIIVWTLILQLVILPWCTYHNDITSVRCNFVFSISEIIGVIKSKLWWTVYVA